MQPNYKHLLNEQRYWDYLRIQFKIADPSKSVERLPLNTSWPQVLSALEKMNTYSEILEGGYIWEQIILIYLLLTRLFFTKTECWCNLLSKNEIHKDELNVCNEMFVI